MDRFRQRFENFRKAYMSFERIAKRHRKEKTEMSEMALIQAFEFTFEVSWKMLKSYLEFEAIIAKSPREAIKHAFQQKITEEGEVWLKAIEVRNETVHTYDDSVRHKASEFIANAFLCEVEKLYVKMKEKYETWTD